MRLNGKNKAFPWISRAVVGAIITSMNRFKNNKLRLITVIVSTVLVVGLGVFIANYSSIQSKRKSQNTQNIPKTEFSKSYLQNSVYYDCSREIELRFTGAYHHEFDGGGPVYAPVNQKEADLYCREGAVIEYHAILDVLELPATQSLIKEHGPEHVLVQALKYDHIQERAYIERLLPAHKDVKIGCIIVVTVPDEKLYLLEDEGGGDYVNIPQPEFESYLAAASAADREKFWSSLH